MADYSQEIADVLEMIEEAGVQCEWRKGDLTPDDQSRPWLGGDNEPDQPFTPFIAFIPAVDHNFGFGIEKLSQGSTSFSTFGLMGAQDFTPEVSDSLTRKGKPMTLVAVDTLAPAGDPVLHILSIQ